MSDADRPLYPINIVAELLNVHSETIRQWENSSVIKLQRRSGKRYFSDNDLKRLRFIQKLMNEGLNLPAIRHYLRLYPCWNNTECPNCKRLSKIPGCAKPCWKEEGSFCWFARGEEGCEDCIHIADECEAKVSK